MIFFKFYAWIAIRMILPLFNIEFFRKTNWLCRWIEPLIDGIDDFLSIWWYLCRRIYCHEIEDRKEKNTLASHWRDLMKKQESGMIVVGDGGEKIKQRNERERRSPKRQWQMHRLIYCISWVVHQAERFPIERNSYIHARIPTVAEMVSRWLGSAKCVLLA